MDVPSWSTLHDKIEIQGHMITEWLSGDWKSLTLQGWLVMERGSLTTTNLGAFVEN